MATMLNFEGRLIRINPTNAKQLQYSTNNGLSWHVKSNASSSMGSFIELMDGGGELIARCEKGLYYSTNEGLSFHFRSR